MIRKQVWRYYCEFCGKSKGTKNAMEIHERHCTMNPKRECRLCENVNLKDALAVLPAPGDLDADGSGQHLTTLTAEDITALKDVTEGCPVCMLAALRQKGFVYWDWQELWDYNGKESKASASDFISCKHDDFNY